MSDFDNYDDLDAVRSFRSAVGIMTPDVDARIRARIVDLATARGVAGSADPTGPTASDLTEPDPTVRPPRRRDSRDQIPPVDDGFPLSPQPSAVPSSSSGSAAPVVELHPAARPPARQPQVLVAVAAALVVVVLFSISVVALRRSPNPGELDVGAPTTTGQAPPPTAAVASTYDELIAIVTARPDPPLKPAQRVRTVDHVVAERSMGNVAGTIRFTQTQVRGRTSNEPTTYADETFTPTGASVGQPVDDPAASFPTSIQFSGFSYDEVRSLPTDIGALHERVLAANGPNSTSYALLTAELQLLRLPFTPAGVKAALLGDLRRDRTVRSVTPAGDELNVELEASTVETFTIAFRRSTGEPLRWAQLRAGSTVASVDAATPEIIE